MCSYYVNIIDQINDNTYSAAFATKACSLIDGSWWWKLMMEADEKDFPFFGNFLETCWAYSEK